MYKQTRFLFHLFLFLTSSSFINLIFYSVYNLFLNEGNNSVEWVIISFFIIGIISSIILYQRKFHIVLKLFLCIFVSLIIIYVSRYIFLTLSGTPIIKVYGIFPSAILSVLFSSIFFIFFIFIEKNFDYIIEILEGEFNFKNREEFEKWINEHLGTSESKTSPYWYLQFIFNLSIVLLLFIFFAIIKVPDSKWIFSILLVLFTYGAVGIYFILYQIYYILNYKIKGYKFQTDSLRTWNKTILLFYIPLIIIPLLIPWNFKIVDTTSFTNYVNKKLSGVQIDLRGKDATANKYIVTNTNVTTIITQEESKTPVKSKSSKLILKYILICIISLIVFYFILGIIGGILLRVYRYKKKSKLIEFFIRRYYGLRGIIDIIVSFILVTWRFLFDILTLRAFRKREIDQKLASPVEKQLFSLFAAQKEMSDEKKEEILTLIKLFVKLIDITSRFVVPYRFYYGPLEYIKKVAENKPELKQSLMDLVMIFNESRYSLHILSNFKKEAFSNLVDFIITEITKEK